MSELSTRAKELVVKLDLCEPYSQAELKLIEQALLAERRLAMGEAIDLAYRSTLSLTQDEEAADAVKETMELNLLPVATPRGGE